MSAGRTRTAGQFRHRPAQHTVDDIDSLTGSIVSVTSALDL
jgi:hypothetical protein